MFTVVGEALLDMVQQAPGDSYRALPGGGPLNIAVGLRRLGHPTALMSRFAAGALGERVRDHALAMDLELSASVTTRQQATLAFASVDDSGHAAYDFYTRDTADWGWTPEELSGLPASSRAVHTGSLVTAIPPGADRVAEWWSMLAGRGQVLLSFDPNVRPALAGPRAEAVRRVERLVASSHVVKASDEDLGWLYPDQDIAASLRQWAALGPGLAVLTRGADGCLGVTPGGVTVELAAHRVQVVDTIGAGDAFQAGLLSALADLGRLSPDAVAHLSEGEVREALSRASLVSALTCQRAGADPPTRAEHDAAKRTGGDG
ncbi:MAG: carbohydrate kinase family protein [Nocardioidaceae bacterium]